MPPKDDRTPGLANALFGPRLGRPVFVAARTSTPLPMSVTDPATNLRGNGRYPDGGRWALAPAAGGHRREIARSPGSRPRPPRYLILVSLKATCLRAIGSYFLKESFSVAVRGFFLVT